jgi:NADPH:quinone reductase-like Zn-dependent oxidoreductase
MGDEIPRTMKALVGNRSTITRILNYACSSSSGDGVKVTTVPVPEIKDNEILVRVRCVAFNPTDFKHVDILSPRGAIIG